jgi:1,4-alpha-glucan branching enzyme
MISKHPGPPGKVRVIFSLPASIWADTVHLVGDFNNWNPSATPLRLGDCVWSVTLDLDAGQSYHYKYLINHTEWVNDWQSDAFAPGDSGNDNSVIIATLPHDKLYTNKSIHPRQRPRLRVIQGGRSDEKQAV